MKHTALSIAIAAACVAGGNASAFDPNVTAPDYQFRIAGATAPTNTLRDVILDTVCTSSRDYYKHKTNNHWSIACGTATGNVLFLKNDFGSGAGTSPVDGAAVAVEFLDVSVASLGAATCAAGVPLVTSAGTPYTSRSGCGNSAGAGGQGLQNLIADVGISDIEPAAFVGALAELSNPLDVNSKIDFENESSMDVRTLAGLGFGIVATNGLYQALQADQFPVGHPLHAQCHPDGADYNVAMSDSIPTQAVHYQGVTEKCMPNMASHTIRSIFSGNLNSWLNLKTGPTGTTNLFQQNLPVGSRPYTAAFPQVKVCRRVQGSGTHARTAVTFLRTNCGSGSIVMQNPTCNTKTNGADCNNGFEGAQGSGDMTSCMNAAEVNSKWAIGYHSVEKNANLADGGAPITAGYRFVKIDGFAPTLENMLSGNYANFGEVTMQIRTVRTGQALANGVDFLGAPSNSADVISTFNTIVTEMSGPAAAEQLNSSSTFRHPYGNAGWAARPATVGSPAPYPQVVGLDGAFDLPVNPLTHVNPSTGSQNSCFGPYAPRGTLVD